MQLQRQHIGLEQQRTIEGAEITRNVCVPLFELFPRHVRGNQITARISHEGIENLSKCIAHWPIGSTQQRQYRSQDGARHVFQDSRKEPWNVDSCFHSARRDFEAEKARELMMVG